MILISINPFVLKRLFLVVVALLGVFRVTCFGDAVLVRVKATPYDQQMGRIQPVLNTTTSQQRREPSIRLVNCWIGELRSIPYGFTREWKTPAETESGAPADCKAKAVALYQRMLANGATNCRLVIGKRTPTSRLTHCWLEWTTSKGDFVLDPTLNWMAYRTDDRNVRSYLPFYAYQGNHRFRALPAALVAQN